MSDETMDVDGDDGGTQGGGGFEWAAPQDELDFFDPASDSLSGRDSVIFAVDFSKTMFQLCKPVGNKSGDNAQKGMSALHTTLRALRDAVIRLVHWLIDLRYF